MPTRHLSDEQRQRYASFAAAPSPDQLSRYFHLDGGDRQIIDGLRGDHNRLGFALMLGSARFLGAFPATDQDVPLPVTAFLLNQLGLPPDVQFKGYFGHGGQRLRHLALIRERFGFTEFSDNGPARFRLARWLYALCWSGDDHPGLLIERATSWLVVNKVLLPGACLVARPSWRSELQGVPGWCRKDWRGCAAWRGRVRAYLRGALRRPGRAFCRRA